MWILQCLLRMAAPLTRFGGIRLWSDADIQPGKNWRQEINKALDATWVAVLLVSDSFLQSHFIQTVELPYFLEVTKTRGVEFMWILVSDCYWERTPLHSIQADLDVKTPVDSMSPSQQKTAWKSVVAKNRRGMATIRATTN